MTKPRTLRMALIGLGRQGHQHWKCLKKLHQDGIVKVVAGCDVTHSSLLEDIPFFSDYRELLNKAQPDVVVIAVPNHLHFEMAEAALKAGCDIIKEKPLATSLAAGHQLVKLANQSNRLILTTQHRYYQELVNRASELLPRLGSITHFSYSFSVNDENQSWYWDIERAGGGSWLNLGWHGLALVTWLMGEVKDVQLAWNSGGKRQWEYATDHSALAHLTLKNGAEGSIFVSCVQPKDESLLIEARDGSLHLTRHHLVVCKGERTLTYPVTQTQDEAYLAMYDQLLSHIQDRTYDMNFDLNILKAIDQGITSLPS